MSSKMRTHLRDTVTDKSDDGRPAADLLDRALLEDTIDSDYVCFQ